MDKLLAKTLFGLEDVLAAELKDMGAENISKGRRSVSFRGDKEMLYRANYNLRTALSVLKPLCSFKIERAKDLYKKAMEFPWEDIMGLGQTFSVVPVVNSSIFNHTAYPALVLKDAIADRFRMKTNRRPSVELKDPDMVFNCHISEKDVTISIDSTIIPLFKRGYRVHQSEAPLNEVLAAGIIMKSGWDMQMPLLDPMCGSGTLAIEAALMARNIPPGQFRRFFGFMNWPDYDQALFKKVRRDAVLKKRSLQTAVYCKDISSQNIRLCRVNIKNAGLEDDIQTEVADFRESASKEKAYMIIMNPPYGERLDVKDIESLYSDIGERLKHGYPGSTAWIISSNTEALKNIGLKPSRKSTLYNGKLEIKLVKYELYSGSKKGR